MGKLFKIKMLYIFLKISLLLLFLKYCYDFYFLNKNYENNAIIVNNKIIYKPRLQTTEIFNYIQASQGIIEKDKYKLNNVKITGTYGDGVADKLLVKDNIFYFEDNININFIKPK
jgi:hypothetical protein